MTLTLLPARVHFSSQVCILSPFSWLFHWLQDLSMLVWYISFSWRAVQPWLPFWALSSFSSFLEEFAISIAMRLKLLSFPFYYSIVMDCLVRVGLWNKRVFFRNQCIVLVKFRVFSKFFLGKFFASKCETTGVQEKGQLKWDDWIPFATIFAVSRIFTSTT